MTIYLNKRLLLHSLQFFLRFSDLLAENLMMRLYIKCWGAIAPTPIVYSVYFSALYYVYNRVLTLQIGLLCYCCLIQYKRIALYQSTRYIRLFGLAARRDRLPLAGKTPLTLPYIIMALGI